MVFKINKLKQNKKLWENKTPCFILDKKIVTNKIKKFKSLFEGEITYSLKTNPNKNIIKLINKSKQNFTVSSKEELLILKKTIKDISKIIYFSPILDETEINDVLRLGVKRFIVDSESQIKFIMPNIQKIEEIFIRIKTTPKIKRKDFVYDKDSNYGMSINKALLYMDILSRKNVKIGIHNHILSQNTSLNIWRKNIEILTKFIILLKEKSLRLDSINFGGGFPISYNSRVLDINKISKIFIKYQKIIKKSYPKISFIFEPGRYLVAESIVLITKIKQVKESKNKNILFVDASLYNSFMDTLIVGLELPCRLINHKNLSKKNYLIQGRSLCSLDIFRKKVSLYKVRVGDYLMFINVGAYNYTSDFMSLKKPKTISIK